MQHLLAIFTAFPDAPAGSPADMAETGIAFFTTWIQRVGGIVSFIGAVKLALSLKNDEGREQLTAILTMISGFMITAAVGGLDIFLIPDTYTEAAATTEFRAILTFIGRWIRRAGAAGLLFGGIMTALAMKDNNPAPKVNGVKYMAVGGMVCAIATIINTFV
ncbi:MAG: hypothetical protein IKG82_04345 [Oscillospiraceae bacterium]|nr:hypothetical protein [Oscillospiraceae bacterium]